MIDTVENLEDMISDLLDDPDFQVIDHRVSHFNLFEAVGAVRGELKHSNFLGFLLAPSRSHGFGTEPLLRFLRGVLTKIPSKRRPIRALELVLGDLDGAIVYREWNNIDLFIQLEALNLVVLIENKIDAKAGDGQLTNYKEIVLSKYPAHRHLFVFLTPNGAAPDDSDYLPFSYAELAKIIELVPQSQGFGTKTDSHLIIRHYVEMLRRHIVPDEELRQLARQLYERHQEAFEFIFEARPEAASLLGVARRLLEANIELTPDRRGVNTLKFVPQAWNSVADLNCCELNSWTRTGRNLIFEIRSWTSGRYADRMIISLISGPAPAEIREKLYSGAAMRTDLFRGLVRPMGKQFATIYMRELLTPTAAKRMDHDDKAAAIEAGWLTFVTDDLPRLSAAVMAIVSPEVKSANLGREPS